MTCAEIKMDSKHPAVFLIIFFYSFIPNSISIFLRQDNDTTQEKKKEKEHYTQWYKSWTQYGTTLVLMRQHNTDDKLHNTTHYCAHPVITAIHHKLEFAIDSHISYLPVSIYSDAFNFIWESIFLILMKYFSFQLNWL